MKPKFEDLRELGGEPKWFGSKGEPRYCDFHPGRISPYAREAVLLRIECQACGEEFKVAIYSTPLELHDYDIDSLEEAVKEGKGAKYLHYGDPPIHDCIGDTMNSIPREILQFWSREPTSVEWGRLEEYEGTDLTPDWVGKEVKENG